MTRPSATLNCFSHKNGAGRGFAKQSVRDVFVRLHSLYYSRARWKFGRLDLRPFVKKNKFESDFPSRSQKTQRKGGNVKNIKHKVNFSNGKSFKGKERLRTRVTVFYIKQKLNFPKAMSNLSVLQLQSFI